MSSIQLETTRHPVARGFRDKHGRMQVGVRMEEETFEAIHIIAQAKNISFAAQVRIFLNDGIKRARGAV